MSGTKQFFSGLDEAGLARFFREMADRLEGKDPVNGTEFGVDPGDFYKLKVGLKRDLDGYGVKVKVKPWQPQAAFGAPAPDGPETGEAPAADDKPKYKSLKKRMKGQFKHIYEHLLNDALPEAGVVAAFLADSRLMTAYPGYGDEHYAEYDAAREVFRDAFEREDLAACKSAAQELNRLKKDCHARHK